MDEKKFTLRKGIDYMKTTAKKNVCIPANHNGSSQYARSWDHYVTNQFGSSWYYSVLSWLVTAVGALLLAYIFAQAGMFSQIKGGMGGYAEHRFGKTGHFMASYAYSISLIIANIAIAVSAVGYGSEFFGVDLNAIANKSSNNRFVMVCQRF